MSALSDLSGKKLSHYTLEHRLDKGGYAEVYLGKDENNDERVAIKILKQRSTETGLTHLLNEVRLLNQLKHPNIMRIRDFGVERPYLFIVMDYAQNGSLRNRHPYGKTVPLKTIVKYIESIAPALQYAHNYNIIHQDIKPENILVNGKNELKLSDFGISTIDHTVPPDRMSDILGTARYVAPERISMPSSPLPASDQYSLGVVVYEWICGHPPFDGKFKEILDQHVNQEPSPLNIQAPAISPAVEQVVMRTLEKDPAKRYPDVQTFAKELRQAVYAGTKTKKTQLLPPLRLRPKKPGKPVDRKKKFVAVGSLLLIIILIGAVIFALPKVFPGSITQDSSGSSAGIATFMAPDHELIGLSEGQAVFDTQWPDDGLKQRAADAFTANRIQDAKTLWQQEADKNPSDAETRIYLENQRVKDSGYPYITLVVGTVLTEGETSNGRDSLQGAYIAQKNFNAQACHPNCLQVRLLIANSGTVDSSNDAIAYTSIVMEQILQARHTDPSIVGVMGWNTSNRAFYSNTVLAANNIPIVSPTGFINDAVNAQISAPTTEKGGPYFFSIAPSNDTQGANGAMYAKEKLNAKHVALIFDPVNPYSESLANAFKKYYVDNEHSIVTTKTYQTNDTAALADRVQDVLTSSNLDLIYFAGNSHDVSTVLSALPLCSNASPCLPVLGGDELYNLGGYTGNAKNNLQHLHFTTFAYPDEWTYVTKPRPTFFTEYQQTFDPKQTFKRSNPYGHDRPDNTVMLSYDAMMVLLTASNNAFNGQVNNFSPVSLQSAILAITGAQAIQGVSGQISFESNGDCAAKSVLVLYFDGKNDIHYDTSYGRFLK